MRTQTHKNEIRNIEKAQAISSSHVGILESLKKTLADEYILQLKTQNAHWNVEGPAFFALHKLFEEQYEKLAEFVDRNAEVIRSLKARSPGSFKEFKELASVREFSEAPLSEDQFIEILSQDHSHLAIALKSRLELAEAAEETSGKLLYEDLIGFHEKAAWMIRSHRQSVDL